ncbi:hypothetical protein GTK47_19825 (plasmid) [Proteus sp. ZN5]|nr:hypothetical protein GTK47_19825 [Proteus sp. ZN5]
MLTPQACLCSEELLAVAKEKQWQRQIETNNRVKERLEQIIGSLKGIS